MVENSWSIGLATSIILLSFFEIEYFHNDNFDLILAVIIAFVLLVAEITFYFLLQFCPVIACNQGCALGDARDEFFDLVHAGQHILCELFALDGAHLVEV